MSAVATVLGTIDHQNVIEAVGTIALSGNYGGGSTHGDTLDLSGLGVPSNSIPIAEISELVDAGDPATVYRFLFCPGTTQKNGVLQIMGAAAEYTQGSAYSSNFPNPLFFRAFFKKFS